MQKKYKILIFLLLLIFILGCACDKIYNKTSATSIINLIESKINFAITNEFDKFTNISFDLPVNYIFNTEDININEGYENYIYYKNEDKYKSLNIYKINGELTEEDINSLIDQYNNIQIKNINNIKIYIYAVNNFYYMTFNYKNDTYVIYCYSKSDLINILKSLSFY